jgi:hypothetical protein
LTPRLEFLGVHKVFLIVIRNTETKTYKEASIIKNFNLEDTSLSLPQTSKNAMSFLLSLTFSLQQNQRIKGQNRFCLAQTMYTYISKCKNDKIKANKKKMTPAC